MCLANLLQDVVLHTYLVIKARSLRSIFILPRCGEHEQKANVFDRGSFGKIGHVSEMQLEEWLYHILAYY